MIKRNLTNNGRSSPAYPTSKRSTASPSRKMTQNKTYFEQNSLIKKSQNKGY